jgi:DNA-binding transcriptional regulator YiaG
MPDIATVLKSEIRRLARKEARAEVDTLKKSSAQYRKDIARLKRDLDRANKKISALEQEVDNRPASAVVPPQELEQRRFSARGLRSHRKRLGLSAAELGELIGVTAQTVYNWEQGKARPRGPQFTRLIELRSLGKRAVTARLERKGGADGAGKGQSNGAGKRRGGRRSQAPEKSRLQGLFEDNEGNVSAVARSLGKAPAQIYRWCEQLGIDPAAYR